MSVRVTEGNRLHFFIEGKINFTDPLPALQHFVFHFISYPLWKTASGYQACHVEETGFPCKQVFW